MVDFGKRIGKKDSGNKIHPVEIYSDLDRTSEAGPLRNIQEQILNKWFSDFRQNRDIILKLHTGQGKTLIGLLILQSLINESKGPCLYICPNRYLVRQTLDQAKKFGIPYCEIGSDNSLPVEFLKGSKILICHVQKLFHGFTIFGLNHESVLVGGIVIDDSHACIDSIREAFTIRIPKTEQAYKDIFNLFEEDLEKQAKGTFAEIKQGVYDAFLPVPYWCFIDKSDSVTDKLAKYREEKFIKFQWPLLKNHLSNCQCFVSGSHIEISPYLNPIEQFGTFNQAKHRVMMSATTMNDSFFIKGLNITRQAVLNPLTIENEKWSGEKMIIMPYLIHESLNRIAIINHYATPSPSRNVGIVALTPSYKHAKIYEVQGCTVAKPATFDQELLYFKQGHYEKPFVIVNRYDGIDLPDSNCRILIMDSKPFSESLAEKYEEVAREDSSITNIRIAQKIEQGLGRSVRGEKDFSVIVIIGGNLINFLRNPKTEKYFSPQTRKQIEIGLEIAEMASEDVDPKTNDMMKVTTDLARQCIVQRDPKWKQFYEERMNEISGQQNGIDITEAIEVEKNAESLNLVGRHSDAKAIVQSYLDKTNLSLAESGWYLQMIARFKHHESLSESNKLQAAAFKNNRALLKQREGYVYKKINLINTTRATLLKNWIMSFGSHEALSYKVNEILSLLTFEESSDHFEEGLKELGLALGFESQRPDKEDREGPDNLWALAENDYLLFECKNEVLSTRDEIHKDESGQMNNSCGWFQNNYAGASFKPIMVITTKNIAKEASFVLEVEILRKNGLKSLKNNFQSFYNELKQYDLSTLNMETIQNLLVSYKLDNSSLKTAYTEKPYQR